MRIIEINHGLIWQLGATGGGSEWTDANCEDKTKKDGYKKPLYSISFCCADTFHVWMSGTYIFLKSKVLLCRLGVVQGVLGDALSLSLCFWCCPVFLVCSVCNRLFSLQDQVIWRWNASGEYSARSTYREHFLDQCSIQGQRSFGKLKHQGSACLRTAAGRRCGGA
jgi:hypothetical protein